MKLNKIKLELIGLLLAVILLILCGVVLGLEIKKQSLRREIEQLKVSKVDTIYVPTPKLINKP